MILIDCNNLKVEPYRMYGGATGSKIGVWYNDKLYMLKTQQNVKKRDFKNVEISYANDPISEYIGSHIYNICGIPAHETILGKYHNKICVLCRDYSYPNKIIEFREWRNHIMDESILQHYSGMSSRLSDIMNIISKVDILNCDEVKQHFWNMFVIDALIGNTDRNNGNWGFIVVNKKLKLYPVYDCGACLNNKKSDNQLSELLNTDKYKDMVYNFTTMMQDESGKRINPLHYIRDNYSSYIYNALNLLPKDFEEIEALVNGIKPVISQVRADWYNKVLKLRLEFLIKCREEFDKNNVCVNSFMDAISKMY